MNELLDNPMQKMWQSQPIQETRLPLMEIRRRAEKFDRQIRWRNWREYAGALVGSAIFAALLIRTHHVLFRVAYAMLIMGFAWVAFEIRRKGSSKTPPPDLGSVAFLDFYRGELERQRDLLRTVWSWYLLPFFPGLVVHAVAVAMSRPYPLNLVTVVLSDGVVVATFVFLGWINMRGARHLQQLINEVGCPAQGQ